MILFTLCVVSANVRQLEMKTFSEDVIAELM